MTKTHTLPPYAAYQLADDKRTYGDAAAKFIIVTEGDEQEVCGVVDSEETASFIVRACNTHYELVEALERITDQLERVGDSRKDAPLIKEARAAIAKATGGAHG